MSIERAWPHVTIDTCQCGWAGMHWHWDGQRFRSTGELDRYDIELMNEEMMS